MAQSQRNRKALAKQENGKGTAPNRPWQTSVAWSAITMAVLLTVAVVANVVIGRVIHWEIVTGLGVLGFVFLTIGRRYRTL